MGSTGAIGLNQLAIDSIMNDFHIDDGEDRIAIRKDVHRLANKVISIARARAKAKEK